MPVGPLIRQIIDRLGSLYRKYRSMGQRASRVNKNRCSYSRDMSNPIKYLGVIPGGTKQSHLGQL